MPVNTGTSTRLLTISAAVIGEGVPRLKHGDIVYVAVYAVSQGIDYRTGRAPVVVRRVCVARDDVYMDKLRGPQDGRVSGAAAGRGYWVASYAWAQQVARNDPRILTEYLAYPSPQGSGTMRGYFARPAKMSGKLPGVVVIHENRGLNPYIEDVARRLAVDNFVAFAPDALTPAGGYPGNEEQAAALYSKLDPVKRREDMFAAVEFLRTRPECTGRIGATGFCAGGGVVNAIAVRYPELAAAVPFYGDPPSAADAAKIKAPLLLHFAALDTRINSGWPAFEAALKAAGVKYQAYIYPNTNHGFHNDTTPRYDEAAAKLAWSRTIAFFKEHLPA